MLRWLPRPKISRISSFPGRSTATGGRSPLEPSAGAPACPQGRVEKLIRDLSSWSAHRRDNERAVALARGCDEPDVILSRQAGRARIGQPSRYGSRRGARFRFLSSFLPSTAGGSRLRSRAKGALAQSQVADDSVSIKPSATSASAPACPLSEPQKEAVKSAVNAHRAAGCT